MVCERGNIFGKKNVSSTFSFVMGASTFVTVFRVALYSFWFIQFLVFSGLFYHFGLGFTIAMICFPSSVGLYKEIEHSIC